MLKQDREYTIEELAQEVGVPVRTIRYYISQGLLPGPGARGKAAGYTEDHLLRLRLIRRLVEQRVPLSETRERLARLSTEDVRALVAEQDHLRVHLQRAARELAPKEYVSELLKRAEETRTLPATHGILYEASPAPQAPPSGMAAASARLGRLFQAPRLSPRTHDAAAWHRWEIAPGVELHIRSDLVDRYRHLIDMMRRAISKPDTEGET